MEIKNVFWTSNDTKFCAWCHSPIPEDRPRNAKFCSKECSTKSRKVYRSKWYQDKKEINKQKREAKKEKERQEFLKRTQAAKSVTEFINSKGGSDV